MRAIAAATILKPDVMIYCVNSACPEPENSDHATVCRCCGSSLQLHDRFIPRLLLAQGGSGRTFLAIDTLAVDPLAVDPLAAKQNATQNAPIQYVIKQIAASKRNAQFLQLTIKCLKRAGCYPHLPAWIDAFSREGYFYVVHEWIAGSSLAAELTESGTFDEAKIWQILNEILPALKFLHEYQLIHQDIKPENIIRRSNGSLVLVDLGSAISISELSGFSFSGSGLPQVGSPEYAAPEQLSGKISFASDLYSLGVTCLHLLTNLSPFDLFDRSLDRCWQDYLTQPVSNALAQILDQLIQRSIQQRFASAQMAIQAISAFQPQTVTQPPKRSSPELTPIFRLPVRHTACISAVAFHPHLAIVASASEDKTIRLWDCQTRQLLTVLTGHQGSVRSIAFSPTDPALIASASDDKTIRLWNWQTETALAVLEGHQASVRSIVLSPNGKFLVSGSWDKTIGVWQLETATRAATAAGHPLQINAVALSRDGGWLASASADRTARLWQFQTTETGISLSLRSTLAGHTWAVTTVAFSPDGQLLATGSNDNTVKLWQVSTGELLRTLNGHSWSVASVQFSSTGRQLFSGSWDQTIKVWQVEDGAELATLVGHSDAIQAIGVACNPTHQNSHQDEQVNPLTQDNWVVGGGRDRQINLWQL